MNAQELQECKDLTIALKKEYDQLESKANLKLNKRIKELRVENKTLTETRSTTSEYFLGTLIFVGFVMFLYAVYISLYSPSLFLIR